MNTDQAFYYARFVASMNNAGALAAWRHALQEMQMRLKAYDDADDWQGLFHEETKRCSRLAQELARMNAARQAAVDQCVNLGDLKRDRDFWKEMHRDACDQLFELRDGIDARKDQLRGLELLNFCVWTLQGIAAWGLLLVVMV